LKNFILQINYSWGLIFGGHSDSSDSESESDDEEESDEDINANNK
jgi:hypothetical protein